MTAQPAGRVEWFPDPVRQPLADHTVEDELVLTTPFPIRLPISDITP